MAYGWWWSFKNWFEKRAIRQCLFCSKQIWPWQRRIYNTIHGMWWERFGVRDYYAHEACGIEETDTQVILRSPIPTLLGLRGE